MFSFAQFSHVCVYVCAHICLQTCTPVWVCAEAGGGQQVSSTVTWGHIPLRRGLSLNLELGWGHPASAPFSIAHSTGVAGMCYLTQIFIWGFRLRSSYSQQVLLPTRPSSGSLNAFLSCVSPFCGKEFYKNGVKIIWNPQKERREGNQREPGGRNRGRWEGEGGPHIDTVVDR